MSEWNGGYIAIPVWDGQQWRPVTFAERGEGDEGLFGYKLIKWPEGVEDLFPLPPPKVNLGQTARFRWDKGIKQGEVRAIHRSGGGFRDHETPQNVARERYLREPWYEIYWNGHGRLVCESNLILDS